MDNEGERRTSAAPSAGVAATITTLLGWIAGAAALVYVAGVGVYAARLATYDVSSPLATTSALPREGLIALGLTVVGLPMLLFGTVYALFRTAEGPLDDNEITLYRERRLSLLWGLVSAGVLMMPALLTGLRAGEDRSGIWWVLGIAGFLTLVVFLAGLGHDLVADRNKSKVQFNRPAIVFVIALMYAITPLQVRSRSEPSYPSAMRRSVARTLRFQRSAY
jgi:hypothetical protein